MSRAWANGVQAVSTLHRGLPRRNDHYILNTIVFSSKVGVEVNGAADYITGVHVWFPVNHAVHFADTMAFHVTGAGNRFVGCYIDGGRAVFEQKALQRNIWTNGFECCQGASPATGTTASGILLVGGIVGPGLQIVNNEFGGGSIYHRLTLPDSGSADAHKAGGADCSARFNVSAAERECQGLSRLDATSRDACATACCADKKCSVYQWCAAGGNCDGATGSDAQCWTGDVNGCTSVTRKGWVGWSTAPSAATVVIKGVRISHNSMGTAKSTQATLSLSQTEATTWAFDFCERLVFPQIAVVRVHVMATSGFPIAVARPPDGCKVTVETSEKVSGTVTVDVDSSEPSDEF